jgi:hypothetical protein
VAFSSIAAILNAAKAIHGAVFLASGSIIIFSGGTPFYIIFDLSR